MDNRYATLILNLLPNVGSVRVRQLLSVYGEPCNVLGATAKELAQVSGIGPQLAGTIAEWEKHCDPDDELDRVERAGVRLVMQDDPEYPALLSHIHDPPLCLYVRGDTAALQDNEFTLGIVGTRRTNLYGKDMATRLGASAARAGWTVVSGLARGVDAFALQEAVQAGGPTVAVLGSGLAKLYPADNIELAQRISDSGGAVVSEFPMHFPPDRRSFPMRNRVIAGISAGTVVVQAAEQSGALITADCALEQGRQVFAVPGAVNTPHSRGCHRLIKEGAKLVEDFGDIVDEFRGAPARTPAEHKEAAGKTSENSLAMQEKNAATGLQLSDLETKILDFVQNEGEPCIDTVISALQESAAEVQSTILRLEMRRLLTQLPGKRVACTSTDTVAG